MKYSVKNLSAKGEFSVPNLIVDKHLRLAGGEQIKVLLFILPRFTRGYCKGAEIQRERYGGLPAVLGADECA